MAFEKVEYKFPDPDDTAKQNIEIEDSALSKLIYQVKKRKKMNRNLTEQMIRESKATPKNELEVEVVMIHRKLTGIVSLLSHPKRSLMKSLKIILKKLESVYNILAKVITMKGEQRSSLKRA